MLYGIHVVKLCEAIRDYIKDSEAELKVIHNKIENACNAVNLTAGERVEFIKELCFNYQELELLIEFYRQKAHNISKTLSNLDQMKYYIDDEEMHHLNSYFETEEI